MYALMIFSNSLKMIKIDQNMLDSWQIVCKKYNFIISEFVGFIVCIVCICEDTGPSFWIVFMVCQVWIFIRTPSILTDIFYVFPQSPYKFQDCILN